MTERLMALALTPAWLACTAGWAGVVVVQLPITYLLEKLK